MQAPKLFIVIPCYNEEEALPITARRMAELLGGCKDLTFAETPVKMLGRPDDAVRAQLEKLAEGIAAR